MTNDVIPGTRDKLYDDQLRFLPAGYKAPGNFDAARAILWENRRSGRRYFNAKPWTYTHCKEMIQGKHLAIGSFSPSGLFVDYGNVRRAYFGLAGWRKF